MFSLRKIYDSFPPWLKRGIEHFNRFVKPLKDDEVIFRLVTTLKISLIPFVTMSVLVIYLSTVLKLNLMFFEANGFGNIHGLEEAYYEYFMGTFLEMLPYIGGICIGIVFMGLYLSEMLLRPFKIIGTYCERRANGEEIDYDTDFFSDLKLLMGFSEYFFHIMDHALKSKQLQPMEVPVKFTKIHKPVFEQAFFIQFSFFLTITSIGLATAIYIQTADIYGHIIKLSIDTLRQNQVILSFLNRQRDLIQEVVNAVMVAHFLAYFALAFHLYNKVATPAFGVFATMRSFMKGNYSSRVHLIGFNYVRPQSRKINYYLDLLQSIFAESKRNNFKSKDNKRSQNS